MGHASPDSFKVCATKGEQEEWEKPNQKQTNKQTNKSQQQQQQQQNNKNKKPLVIILKLCGREKDFILFIFF